MMSGFFPDVPETAIKNDETKVLPAPVCLLCGGDEDVYRVGRNKAPVCGACIGYAVASDPGAA